MVFRIKVGHSLALCTFLSLSSVLALAVLLAHPAAAQGTQPCPASPPQTPPPPNVTAPAATLIPADECEPAGFSGNPITFFDDYSWRAFIALVWPVKAGQRGVPDPSQPLGAANIPSVFETYKADWETFQQNAQKPTDWNSFSFNSVPCSNANDIQPGDMVLAAFNKFGNVGEAGVGSLTNVLVAQNGTYVVYLAAYNQSQFNLISGNGLYDQKNLPPPTQPGLDPPVTPSPVGAMTLKSSWIEMTTAVAHPERFHTRTAWVKDLSTGVCAKKTVGLVGLHIVQKTPNRPQWIWSTFEQVDNVPEPDSPPNQAATFNNGDGSQMKTLTQLCSAQPTNCPYQISHASPTPPPPFNVDRQKPINPSTLKTNASWQGVLQQQGSVWQFYKLTMTQWPVFTDPKQQGAPQPSCGVSPGCDGSPKNTFPGTIAGILAPSAFANTTLETFEQNSVFTGCMACHNSARKTDFVWSIPMLASNPPSAAQTTPTNSQVRASALKDLQRILEQPPQ
jgi:hypothetical protein